jgi:hypothetical protein
MELDIKTATTENVVRTVLGKMYDRFGFGKDTHLISEIVTILDDPEKSKLDDEVVTPAASEIREMLWNRYSGGGASATATADLFHTLGRQNELGWLLEEAPGYRFKG